MNKIEIRKTPDGKYYFCLRSRNGQTNLTSISYFKRDDAIGAVEAAKELVDGDENIEALRSQGYEHYFVLRKGGEIFIKSRCYASLVNMNDGLKAVRKNIQTAILIDLTAGVSANVISGRD